MTYTSACCTQTVPIAKRCNSPPESLSMSRSRTWRSSARAISQIIEQRQFVLTHGIYNLFIIVHLSSALQEACDCPVGCFDSTRDLINILGLDDSFEVILEDFGEVIYGSSVPCSA